MSHHEYQVDLCTNFVRIGQADAFDFAAVLHRNTVGEWEARIPDGGATFGDGKSITNVDSIIVWESTSPARIVFAGSMAPTGSVDTGLSTTHSAQGRTHILSGVDLFGMLGQRVAYPDPGTESPWSTGYDTRTGAASTVAAGYIVANMGATASIEDRRISGVTVVDGGVGETVSWSARLQPLSTLVTQICNAGQIVCRPRMTTPGEVRYAFTTGADRTSQTVLSEHDLTGDITVTQARARATFALAGGDGALTARKFAGSAWPIVGFDRVESFYDVSTLTTVSSVQLAALGSLMGSAAETSVEFATLLPDRWRYLDHFDIGDWVTVEVDDVRYSCLVDGVAFTLNPSTSNIRPLLGRTTPNEARAIMRRLWGSTDRFNANIS